MAAKLTRLIHKIAIQLHLVAGSYTICSSRSRRPVRNLLDTASYLAYPQRIKTRISIPFWIPARNVFQECVLSTPARTLSAKYSICYAGNTFCAVPCTVTSQGIDTHMSRFIMFAIYEQATNSVKLKDQFSFI